jgi:hypothetical protein
MPSSLLESRQAMSRQPAFWLVLCGVVATQLMAFYLLCSHQVRKAENRRAAVEVQRMAHADCLQYLAQSTIGSCAVPFIPGTSRPAAAESGAPVTLVSR